MSESAQPSRDHRIAHVALDEATILWRSADVEQERRIAIYDLIEENSFKPLRAAERGASGPYRLNLAVADGRLALSIASSEDELLEELILGPPHLGLRNLDFLLHGLVFAIGLDLHELVSELRQPALECH